MRYTQEQMRATIEEWQSSGLGKKAFCKERHISYPTFHYWCKRLRSTLGPGFVEINLPGGAQGLAFEVTFPSGARMNFQGAPSASWLRELVK